MYAEVERRAAELRPTATDFTLEVNLRPRNDQSLAFHAARGYREVGHLTQADGHQTVMLEKAL